MDLPLQPERISIPVDNDSNIQFHLKPLDDVQLLKLFGLEEQVMGEKQQEEKAQELAEDVQSEQGGRERIFSLARDTKRFRTVLAETLIEVTDKNDPNGLTIQGDAFDPENDRHFFALPFVWRVKILEGMVSQGQSITEEMVGNSEAQDTPSDEGSTHTQPSTEEKPA